MSDEEENQELWLAYIKTYLQGHLEENMLMYRLVFVAGLRFGKDEFARNFLKDMGRNKPTADADSPTV